MAVLDAEAYPKMPRNRSKAVPEANGPVPQHDKFGPDQPTLVDIHRLFEEKIDGQLNLMKCHFDELDKLMEKMRETNQRLAGLEHDAWQAHLAMQVDVILDKKTRKHTEDTAAD